MGIENNECVIATTYDSNLIKEIKEWINNLKVDDFYKSLFIFSPVVYNGKQTIIYCPDGSKKGWQPAEESEIIRKSFIKKLESYDYDDGSNPFDWVEVSYGEFGQSILRGNCTNKYISL